jgi:hypothetical protein
MEHSMVVPNVGDARRLNGAAGLKRLSLYWIATMYVALTSFLGGLAAVQHASPLFDEVLRLGYPPHFSTLLGVWKVLGAIVLIIPRRPLLKEWAYAGMFIDVTGAIVAYASVGDPMSSYISPLLWMTALVASWHLRPPSRRIAESIVNTD